MPIKYLNLTYMPNQQIDLMISKLGLLVKRHWVLVASLFLIQFFTYSYLYTTITFSNHTFPNVWLFTFPSYRTTGEGRWLHDLIIQSQGGSGVQAYQMFIATLLQAINGILFATLLRWRHKITIFLLSATLCLYPAFLDYYGFAVDHLSFVVADTFCLLAAWASTRLKSVIIKLLLGAVLYTFALSVYAPKIALVSFMSIATLILNLTHHGFRIKNSHAIKLIRREFFISFSTLLLAITMFLLVIKITVVHDSGARTHINDVLQMFEESKSAYSSAIQYFVGGVAGVPRQLFFLPILGIGLGSIAMIWRSYKINIYICTAIIALILLMPLALYSPWIVNSEAWRGAGRLHAAHGYMLIFFLSWGLRLLVSRWVAKFVLLVLLWSFLILASQQTNAIAFKSFYETSFINRLAVRVEPILNPEMSSAQPLVVIGQIPPFDISPYVKVPPRFDRANILFGGTFAPYRQIEILNYFLGGKILRPPSQGELSQAIEPARLVQPWPADGSIFSSNGTVIIVLQSPEQKVPLTRQIDR